MRTPKQLQVNARSQADDEIVIEVNNDRISYWREYFDTSSK